MFDPTKTCAGCQFMCEIDEPLTSEGLLNTTKKYVCRADPPNMFLLPQQGAVVTMTQFVPVNPESLCCGRHTGHVFKDGE